MSSIVSSPSPNIHSLVMCSKESLGETTNLLDLAMELADRSKSGIARLGLGDLHVRSLQSLRQNVHDLGRNISNIVVPHVDLAHHTAEPLEALLDVGLEAGRDGGRNRERDQRRDLLEVVGIDANKELVEDLGLAVGRDPLRQELVLNTFKGPHDSSPES